jgi:hypothetical protein
MSANENAPTDSSLQVELQLGRKARTRRPDVCCTLAYSLHPFALFGYSWLALRGMAAQNDH